MIQKLKCPKTGTPFFGQLVSRKEDIHLRDIFQYILERMDTWKRAGMLPSHVSVDNVKQTCMLMNFNTEHDPSLQALPIPLLHRSSIGNCKQFVFGRVKSLEAYYRDPRFITLDVPDEIWSDDGTYTMYMNDLYVYCASIAPRLCLSKYRPDFFPIRIVLDPNDAILFKKTVKKGTRQADERFVGEYSQDTRFSSVLAREICQLINLFQYRLYQSTTHRYIFFLRHDPVSRKQHAGLTLIESTSS